MFQLQIADADVSTGSIAVSWCLDHELLQELAAQNLHDPQVVIVIAPTKHYHTSKESRKVVPLKDLMTYIECKSAGHCKIYGLVSFRKPKDCREHYLSKEDGDYQNNVLDYDGESYSSRLIGQEDRKDVEKGIYKYLSQPLPIFVPKAVFAKDPPKWEKPWVNHYFRSKAVDQCNYRRRRLFAYGIQPFLVLGNLLLRAIIIAFAALTLCKNISLKYLFHPLMYSLKDTMDVFEKGSLAVVRQPEDDDEITKFPPPGYFIRSFYKLPIMPLFFLPIIYMIVYHKYTGLIIMGSAIAVVFAILLFIGFMVNHFKAVKQAFAKAVTYFQSDELWYMNKEDMQIITCNTESSPTTYKSLPARRKTIGLRFQNLKTKVCKPFSV